jgi:phosphopantetheinyl transferase
VASRSRVEVWLIDLERDGGAFADMAERHGLLGHANTRRLTSFSRHTDALAFAATRAGIGQVLQQSGATAGAPLHRTRSGKPFALGLPAISVSHTHSHVAIATHQGRAVGIDIETTNRRVPEHAIISRIAQLLGDRWRPDQLQLGAWTVIEAWVKLHGLTLSEVLDSPGRGRELEAAVETPARDVRLARLVLPDGLVGACWYEGSDASISIGALQPGAEPVATYPYPNAWA